MEKNASHVAAINKLNREVIIKNDENAFYRMDSMMPDQMD